MTARRRFAALSSGSGLASLAAAFAIFLLSFGWFSRAWLRQSHDSVALTTTQGFADAQLIVWVLNWVDARLRSDFGRILDAPINYPAARQLTGSEHFATSQLLFFPIDAVVDSPLVAANLTAFLFYPLTALSMYALLRLLGARGGAAMFGGFGLALGPLQVPSTLQVLQTLPIFYPLTAITLRSLRESPSATRAVLCAVALLAGLLSSFYTAMLLTMFFVLWALVEGLRARPNRIRFAIGSSASLLVAVAVFLATSWAYLQRPEVASDVPMVWTPELLAAARGNVLLRAFGERHFGGVGVALSLAALLGLVSLTQADLRAYALGCIAVAASGLFIAFGGIQQLGFAELPWPLGDVALFAGRFFRVIPRGMLLTGFAFAALGALGLETLRRSSPRGGAVAVVALTAILLATRGTALGRSDLMRVRAFADDTSVYQKVGAIVGGADRGPLLELPRRPRMAAADASAMMGQIWHGVPLITGHTGYLPLNRSEVDRLSATPLQHDALRSLVAMTKVRWILLQPRDRWRGEREYSLTVGQLRSFPGLIGEYAVDGFLLFQLGAS